MKHFTIFAVATAALCLAGCAPKIYVIDRQTVLEQDAAGEWPDFEKLALRDSIQTTATALATTPPSASRQRLFRLLNGSVMKASNQ